MFPSGGGMMNGRGVLLTQTTSYGCVSARKKKILAEPRALLWLRAGGTIDIHGWHLHQKSKTEKRKIWKAHIVLITEKDFPEETVRKADNYGEEED